MLWNVKVSPEDPPSVQEAIGWASKLLSGAGLRHPRQDAELLLSRALSRDRTFLHAHPERKLDPSSWKRFSDWVERRLLHFPIQYLTGEQEFYGRRFRVAPGVFIPRPETEHLVEEAVQAACGIESPFLLELGTGSGCVAVTLALELPQARIVATDVAGEALSIARANAVELQCAHRIEFRLTHWFEGFDPRAGRFDLIVSNPPYIGTEERQSLDREVRVFEPDQALFAGPNGLRAYEAILDRAADFLNANGKLLLELGAGQYPAVSRMAGSSGWLETGVCRDLGGRFRCLSLTIARPPQV